MIAVELNIDRLPDRCNHCPVFRPEFNGGYHLEPKCLAAGRFYTPEEKEVLHTSLNRPIWCPLLVFK